MIRRPTPDDVPDLARIHVQAWEETYTGLIPKAEITARDLAYRTALWAKLVDAPALRTAYAPGLGFAQMGPQRDAPLAEMGYPVELYSLYVLREGQGRGLVRQLLAAVVGDTPFTALMVHGNARAERFYKAAGARHLDRREVTEGNLAFTEDAFGWTPPFAF